MKKLLLMASILCATTMFGFLSSGVTHAYAPTTADIVVQTIPGPTVAQRVTTRTKASWPWFLARGSGFVAAGALFILLISGIGLVTGYTYKFLEPLTAWASHRALGLTFGVAVLVHMFSLLFDKFAPFTILQVLVPWLSSYKPSTILGFHVGTLYVALGVLAFYLTVLVVITSLVWIEKKPYIWKLLHLLSYIILFFVYVHALFLGSDLTHGILRIIWLALGALLVLFVLHRLWRAKTV